MLEIENLVFKGPYKTNEIFNIPHECGVYIFYDFNMKPMYVGKTLNLNDRYKSHKNISAGLSKVALCRSIVPQSIHYYEYAITKNETDANMYEMLYTRQYKPVLVEMAYKDIPHKIKQLYSDIKTTLEFPHKEGDIIDRKTIRVNHRIFDDFNNLWRKKYKEYKQQDLISLALEEFVNKYK